MVHKTEKRYNSECNQDNSALVKRWFKEVWNDRRIEAIDELLSSDFLGHYEHEEIKGKNHWKEKSKYIPDHNN